MAHIGLTNPFGELTLATTDFEKHVTYIRGFYVPHPYNADAMAQPDHTVAHELGYITLHTHNEVKAERRGMELWPDSL